MKILHTNFLHGWGGQSNRILTVCRGLTERGNRVVIAAPGDSELVRRARAAGIECDGSFRFARGFRPAAQLRDIRRMRWLLAEGAFDLVHTHGSQDSWVVALANRPKRLPVVRTKHNVFPIADHFANRWLYGRVFDRIICIARAIFDQCAAKPYIRADRLTIIHSAVELERFREVDPGAVGSLRAQWGKDRNVVAIVGRLRPEKGHRYLLEAVARLRADFPAILLAVAGDGSLRRDLEQMAESLGIGPHVRFLGFRTDIPVILAAADVFVMPSLSEGLGTAAIEASAAGCAIVASRTGGLTDVVLDGETGLLVAPRDVEALAGAVAELLTERERAARMARAAKRRALEQFSPTSLVEKTGALYRGLFEAARKKH